MSCVRTGSGWATPLICWHSAKSHQIHVILGNRTIQGVAVGRTTMVWTCQGLHPLIAFKANQYCTLLQNINKIATSGDARGWLEGLHCDSLTEVCLQSPLGPISITKNSAPDGGLLSSSCGGLQPLGPKGEFARRTNRQADERTTGFRELDYFF